MMLKNQKKMAAEVGKAGAARVKIVAERAGEVKEAITKADIKALIKSGAIIVKPARSSSRGRARHRHKQRKKGRMRGAGRRKGAKKARTPAKRVWISKIRLLRKTLQALKEQKRISAQTYKELCKKAKGGFFRGKRHMIFYMEQNKLLK